MAAAQIIIYESDRADAAFYFAAEEYIMRELRPAGAALMLWSTDDTVMIGANQVAAAECDLAYMKGAGIELVRRPSGGGAIFTDRGTLQCTVILPFGASGSQVPNEPSPRHTDDNAPNEPSPLHADDNAPDEPSPRRVDDAREAAREWLAAPAIEALAAFGIEASLEGRNDIMISGKKVSGLAQHVKDGYICSHGSLLIDTDLEKLARALTVDREKIKTKAIASVRARVANVADYIAEKETPLCASKTEEPSSLCSAGQKEPSPLCSSRADTKRTVPVVFRPEKSTFDSKMKEKWQKIAVMNDYYAKKAEKQGKTAKISGKIVHNRKKVQKTGNNPVNGLPLLFLFSEGLVRSYARRGALSRRAFGPEEIGRIEEIMRERYLNPEWTFGRDPAFAFANKRRFPGGSLEVFLDVKGGAIREARIAGDFLALRPVSGLEELLRGVPHREDALAEALRSLDVESCLGSLGASELLAALIDAS